MKTILKSIFGLACLASIVLAGAENPDGSCNILWTVSFLALAGITGWAFGKLEASKK